MKPCTACQPVLTLRPKGLRLEGMRSNRRGHVKVKFRNRESSKLDTGAPTIIYSRSSDLAKLNPKCHINYSIIFTEISF